MLERFSRPAFSEGFAIFPLVIFVVVAGPAPAESAERTVVIAPLHVATGKPSDTHLGELAADVLGVAMSAQSQVSVVERRRLDDVLREQKLGLSGLVDAASAAKVGKLLLAETVLAGSVVETAGKLKFVVQVIAVDGGKVLGVAEAEAERGVYDQAMVKLASRVAEISGNALPKIDPAALDDSPVGRLHLMRGIGFYHANNPDQAIAYCLRAVQLDPRLQEARLWIARAYLLSGEPRHARAELVRLARTPAAKKFAAEIEVLEKDCESAEAKKKSG